MNEISELERRISAALDRIGQSAARFDRGGDGPDAADYAALQHRLEEERTVNAQLEERVRGLKERQDSRFVELEAQIAAQKSQMVALDAELQTVRQANAELREVTGQLRTAVDENVSAPELVNRAVLAELDALRAARAADLAEVDAVLAELAPHLGTPATADQATPSQQEAH